MKTMTAARILAGLALAALIPMSGCMIFGIASAVGANIEKGKEIEVLAKYRGLENKSVAVLAHTDMRTAYEYPTALPNIVGNVANSIQKNVGGARVLDPRYSVSWMHQNPGWPTTPLADLTSELDVDRVVVVDVYEYRLNPEGNSFMWDGVAGANIGIVERDGIDPDSYAEEFQIISKFPDMEGIGKAQAGPREIEIGLQKTFVDQVSYLFYDHIEAKYPDRGIRRK
ncbi:MAG: hypothetical protein EXS17_04720 [Phycisphaerales bacterium]|nr:hypothetical protein [Phycisphaerales bacterium]